MPRLRIHFSKRGYACFISHIDLPILFSRAARRAGLRPEQTQGFSPHPRTALGPPLPVGVVGLDEPADFWFLDWGETSVEDWGRAMPEGLAILDAREVDGVSLHKLCQAAEYLVRPLIEVSLPEMALALAAAMGETGPVLDIAEQEGEIRLVVSDIERSSASKMVKGLVAAGLICGWGDLAIVRAGVGLWDHDNKQVVRI